MNKQEGVFSPQKSNNKYTQSPPAQLLYSTTLLFWLFFPYLSHSRFPLFVSTHLPHSSLFSSRLLLFSWCFSTLSFMCIFFAAHFLRNWLHNFLFFFSHCILPRYRTVTVADKQRVLAAFCGCVPHWYKILETRCVLMLQQNKSYKSVSCRTSPQFISNLWLRPQLCVTPPSISIFSSPHSYLCFLLPPVLLSPRKDNLPSVRPSPPPLLSTSLWAGEHCEGWATVLVGGRALTFWCVPFFSCHGLCLILFPSLDGENRACFFVCSGRGLLGKRW